jgi:hypothetical protein
VKLGFRYISEHFVLCGELGDGEEDLFLLGLGVCVPWETFGKRVAVFFSKRCQLLEELDAFFLGTGIAFTSCGPSGLGCTFELLLCFQGR